MRSLRTPDAVWLWGSVNVSRPLTDYCYDEGDAFTLKCTAGYSKNDGRKHTEQHYMWWMFVDSDGDLQEVAGIPKGYRPWSRRTPTSAVDTLRLTKYHDNGQLRCYHGSYNNTYQKQIVDGSLAVRFRMRRDGVCPDAEYMSLSGAIDYSYEPATSGALTYNYNDDEWLNMTCSLSYPRKMSFYYECRYMWWEFKGSIYRDTKRKQVVKVLHIPRFGFYHLRNRKGDELVVGFSILIVRLGNDV
ncbi:hypothetical protein EVAR_56826_1 [Eumeta japonica]|uniref:Uncharacterized protein n=1 Tax=Eumeta variegata TaxID=151549 RepID=A0A4C1ZBW8_EUMVA|nr:hypothetical protein EVAR_56826_1 [Eumeta japonica]